MTDKLAYIEDLEAQITDAQRHLNSLKANREKVLEAAQHEEIEHLEEHLEHAQISLKEILNAAEDAWLDLKVSLDQTMHTIGETIERLLHH